MVPLFHTLESWLCVSAFYRAVYVGAAALSFRDDVNIIPVGIYRYIFFSSPKFLDISMVYANHEAYSFDLLVRSFISKLRTARRRHLPILLKRKFLSSRTQAHKQGAKKKERRRNNELSEVLGRRVF